MDNNMKFQRKKNEMKFNLDIIFPLAKLVYSFLHV